jgi:hypothetical protein
MPEKCRAIKSALIKDVGQLDFLQIQKGVAIFRLVINNGSDLLKDNLVAQFGESITSDLSDETTGKIDITFDYRFVGEVYRTAKIFRSVKKRVNMIVGWKEQWQKAVNETEAEVSKIIACIFGENATSEPEV